MPELSRRRFITTVAKGSASIAILGVAACSGDTSSGTTTTAAATSTSTSAAPQSTAATTAASTTTPPTSAATTVPAGETAVVWERVNLGNVSAYILERAGEAALVDTGLGGSVGDIEEALGRLGLVWGNLGHVVLTHSHGDHVGSIDAVMAAAPDAVGYIGEGDAAAVSAPRPLTILNDGDRVFDLDIFATPGHTPGSISVFDPIGRVLVSGDAVLGGAEPGSVAGASPRFSQDMAVADRSVIALARLRPEAILPGHGEPVNADAATKLDDLAASL